MRRKIFMLSLFTLSLSPLAFAQEESSYVVRRLEATSSKENPGTINVVSSFEKKTADGQVISDSRNESVDVSGLGGYSIRMNDSDAGFTVSQAANDYFFDPDSGFVGDMGFARDPFEEAIAAHREMMTRMERAFSDTFVPAVRRPMRPRRAFPRPFIPFFF